MTIHCDTPLISYPFMAPFYFHTFCWTYFPNSLKLDERIRDKHATKTPLLKNLFIWRLWRGGGVNKKWSGCLDRNRKQEVLRKGIFSSEKRGSLALSKKTERVSRLWELKIKCLTFFRGKYIWDPIWTNTSESFDGRSPTLTFNKCPTWG